MEKADFVKGALIGSCLGGVLAFFIAPSSGNKLREDILNGYNNLHDQTHEYIDDIKDHAQCAMDSFHGQDHNPNAFLIGSASGAVIGALAGLLLAPKAGHKLREQLGDEYEEICKKAKGVVKGIQGKGCDFEGQIEEWKDIFQTIVDKFSSAAPKVKREVEKKAESGWDEMLNWANLGLRFYNQLQSRR